MTRKISSNKLEENMFSLRPDPKIPFTILPPLYQNKSNINDSYYTIEELLEHGKVFKSEKWKNNTTKIGIYVALSEVREYVKKGGIIATLPVLIAAYSKVDTWAHFLKKHFGHYAYSEENVIPDKEGILTSKKKSVYMCIHGGGILTPERIFKAYEEGLIDRRAARYTDEEARNILKGILPYGEEIDMYHVDDVVNDEIPNPFGRYAVWMEFDQAKESISKGYKLKEFMENRIVLARAGTLRYLRDYYDSIVKDLNEEVGCFHSLDEINPTLPEGRYLFIYKDCTGLNSECGLYGPGSFIGMVPRTQEKSQKEDIKR